MCMLDVLNWFFFAELLMRSASKEQHSTSSMSRAIPTKPHAKAMRRSRMVEVPGIEPGSPVSEIEVSTCLVCFLSFSF